MGSAAFAGPASSTTVLHVFRGADHWGDTYTAPASSGFVRAPLTGTYVFWISGDDNCELRLIHWWTTGFRRRA